MNMVQIPIKKSHTLLKICEHMSPNLLDTDKGYVDFPFHLENFCREMDAEIAHLKETLETFSDENAEWKAKIKLLRKEAYKVVRLSKAKNYSAALVDDAIVRLSKFLKASSR